MSNIISTGEWPRTPETLRKLGWTKGARAKCRSCAEPITFWTTSNGKLIPLQRVGDSLAPHWASCPQADKWRKPRKAVARG